MPTETKNSATAAEEVSGAVPTERQARRMSSVRTKSAAAALVAMLLLLASMIFAPLRPLQRFNYDESDYMYAVSKGFWANYLDNPTLSPIAFGKAGVQGLRPANWAKLSQFIRQSDDITLYRHYHGPLHFYSILVAKAFLGNATERSFRLVTFSCLLLAAIVLFIGSVVVVPEYGALTGCLASLFLLTSPNNIQTAMWLTPHTLYLVTALCTLFMIAKLVQSRSRRYLYGSVVCIGIAFAAIEYAILLVVTLLIVIFAHRKSIVRELIGDDNPYKIAGTCIMLFLATVVALWPGGIFKLTLVKNYLFFLYFSTIRSSAAYGTDSLARVWYLRMRGSPLEAIVLLTAIGIFLWKLLRKQSSAYLLPFAVYGALVTLTVVRNRSSSPFYISSLLPPLYFIVAALTAELFHARRKLGYAVIALIVCTFLANGYLYAYHPLSRPQTITPTDSVVQVLSGVGQGKSLLVPHDYVPTIHYYYPSNRLTAYSDASTLSPREVRGLRFDGLVYVDQNDESLEHIVEMSGMPAISARADSGGVVVAYIPLRGAHASE